MWSAIALLFFGYCGWIVAAIIARLALNKYFSMPIKKEIFPTATLIVSAYNEQEVIEEKIQNCLLLNYPMDRLKIIIASESTDETNNIVSRHISDRITLASFQGREGKSATINRVLEQVNSELVIFSDANAMYDKNAIQNIANNFYDPRVGCVIGHLKYVIESENSGVHGEGLYWWLDIKFREAVSGIKGFVPGINGSIFAIRRNLYFPISYNRGDDYELCTRIVNRGYIAVFEKNALAYEVARETNSQQYNRKVRLAKWNITSSFLLALDALKNKNFRSFAQIILIRGIRYLSPLILLIIFYLTYKLSRQSIFYFYLFVLEMVVIIISIIVLIFNKSIKNKILNALGYFLLVNIAATMALLTVFNVQSVWSKQR